MKNFILYLWQLPQNILGLLVIGFTQAEKTNLNYWYSDKFRFGVSLGKYIIFGQMRVEVKDIDHEKGHQRQSLYLGWLYLLLIGLPSFLFNLYDQLFHTDWQCLRREMWYYNLPWENWADKLGHVRRFSDNPF